MNKLFTKIVGAALGLTMAIGIGVAVANGHDAVSANAASPGSSIYTSGQPDWGTGYNYGEQTLNSVKWYATTYGFNNCLGWNKSSQDKSSSADFGPLTKSDSSYGMYQTSGDFTNAQKITVSLSNTDAQKGSYNVLYSTDSGSTWTEGTNGSVTATKGSAWTISYDHGSKIGNSVRFAFGIYGNTNTTGTRVAITQIEVWAAAAETTQTITGATTGFVGTGVSLSTNATSSTSWTITANTAGASLTASTGTSTTVNATQAGSVTVQASCSGYTTASHTITFEAPSSDPFICHANGVVHHK